MKPYLTIGLLVISNIFMTFAWYGQLRLKGHKWFDNLPFLLVVVFCWGIAFLEYLFQVPANGIGFRENGGPFRLMVKTETFSWNHAAAFACLVLAVYFVFRK